MGTQKQKGDENMLPENAVTGFAQLYAAYEKYCAKARERHEKPITFLSYIAALF